MLLIATSLVWRQISLLLACLRTRLLAINVPWSLKRNSQPELSLLHLIRYHCTSQRWRVQTWEHAASCRYTRHPCDHASDVQLMHTIEVRCSHRPGHFRRYQLKSRSRFWRSNFWTPERQKFIPFRFTVVLCDYEFPIWDPLLPLRPHPSLPSCGLIG